MYDKELVVLTSWMGTLILDGVCMKLTALGESIKNLDKITNKELLSQYPEIPWRGVMGTRDIIAHHYFDVDAFEIFSICKNDLVPLQVTIKKMISDLEQDVKGSVGTGQSLTHPNN